jgi:hypothetical protein
MHWMLPFVVKKTSAPTADNASTTSESAGFSKEQVITANKGRILFISSALRLLNLP